MGQSYSTITPTRYFRWWHLCHSLNLTPGARTVASFLSNHAPMVNKFDFPTSHFIKWDYFSTMVGRVVWWIMVSACRTWVGVIVSMVRTHTFQKTLFWLGVVMVRKFLIPAFLVKHDVSPPGSSPNHFPVPLKHWQIQMFFEQVEPSALKNFTKSMLLGGVR